MFFLRKKLIILIITTILASCSPFLTQKKNHFKMTTLESQKILKPYIAWKASVGKADIFKFTPIFKNGNIFSAAADGTILCLNAISGKIIWRINIGTTLTAGIGGNENIIVVVSKKGIVQTFDKDGKFLWKTQTSSEVLSAPAVSENLVIVRSVDNRISAYDIENGHCRWTVLRPLPTLTLHAAPGLIVDLQTVYVALPGGRLSALSLNDGTLRWEVAISVPFHNTDSEYITDVLGMPIIDFDTNSICITAYQGYIGCFNINNGKIRWIKKFLSNHSIAINNNSIFAIDDKNNIIKYTHDTGELIWINNKLSHTSLSTPPISIDKIIAVGDYQGCIYFLSQSNGALVAHTCTNDSSPIQITPIIAGKFIVFQNQAGTIFALAME